ncbi:MAG: 23S rRNA (pseudouridine(1915)-N(3))-methyltransferase RlmH [Candidatus Parcubacteria bacterium]|nr:23S rRNA (pseudouridine(1915)-N(3))-methyltransferase RlmH [Candidatus Parcubacteria bacterium]
MKIKIITISKTKTEYEQAEQEFLKRLQGYADLEILNLREEPITKNRPEDEIMEIEGERILAKLDKDYFIVALHVMGNQMSSEEFADFVEEIRDFKSAKICFVIGGPLGLSQRVLDEADFVLSFSKMTFTHQLIRLLLLEQIYRAFEILKGTEYHK